MTLTKTSSPTDTTCSASSTCLPQSSEMCTRPSMPSATRTNAPNGTSLVTFPGAIWPIACVRAKTCHGSSCVALSDSETRSRSRSTSRISTVTSWPTSTTSLACSMCFHESSETCTRPSTPPRSTNAPKLTIEDTTPLRTWPFWRLLRNVLRDSLCVCSSSARRLRHDVVAVLVELEDLGLDLLAEVRREVADAAQLDERRRQEAAEADVDDQAALDDLDDRTGDDAVVILDLLDVTPCALVLGALLGQDEAAFFVLLLENEGFDQVADLDDLGGVDVVLDREFAGGDDTLGLVADVEEDLVAVDLDDGSFDEVSVVEELESQFDRGQEVFSRSDVVDGDLLGGRGGRCGCHVVVAPIWT